MWQIGCNACPSNPDAGLFQETRSYLANGGKANGSAIQKLLDGGYGYRKSKQSELEYSHPHAVSLITKYLYFLSLVFDSSFPIYDSLVLLVMGKIPQHFPATPFPNIKGDGSNLVASLIAAETRQMQVWNIQGKYAFAILDYILWRTGKALKDNYALLVNVTDYQHWLTHGTCSLKPTYEKIKGFFPQN